HRPSMMRSTLVTLALISLVACQCQEGHPLSEGFNVTRPDAGKPRPVLPDSGIIPWVDSGYPWNPFMAGEECPLESFSAPDLDADGGEFDAGPLDDRYVTF